MFLPLLMMISTQQQVDLYIGTYTSSDGSKGIYHATLNTATGEVSVPELAAEAQGPSFLAIHGGFLYAVHESTQGEVSAYKIGGDKKLLKLNTQAFKGSGPCHLAVDPKGEYLFVAAYGGGSVGAFPISSDGSLAGVASTFKNQGFGPDKGRQEAPHMHSVLADTKGRVYACDLGTDEILTFTPKAGDLGAPLRTKTPAGGGPRHGVLHPNGRHLYANNEMTNSVCAYRVDAHTGALNLKQTLATLPEGEPAQGKSTAEIHIHPNGKWLYVSNRGHDSIASFAVGADGTLTLIEIERAGVKNPRGFALDPTGKWLVVGGQSSGELTALQIDQATGALRPTGKSVKVDKPVCIVVVS